MANLPIVTHNNIFYLLSYENYRKVSKYTCAIDQMKCHLINDKKNRNEKILHKVKEMFAERARIFEESIEEHRSFDSLFKKSLNNEIIVFLKLEQENFKELFKNDKPFLDKEFFEESNINDLTPKIFVEKRFSCSYDIFSRIKSLHELIKNLRQDNRVGFRKFNVKLLCYTASSCEKHVQECLSFAKQVEGSSFEKLHQPLLNVV